MHGLFQIASIEIGHWPVNNSSIRNKMCIIYWAGMASVPSDVSRSLGLIGCRLHFLFLWMKWGELTGAKVLLIIKLQLVWYTYSTSEYKVNILQSSPGSGTNAGRQASSVPCCILAIRKLPVLFSLSRSWFKTNTCGRRFWGSARHRKWKKLTEVENICSLFNACPCSSSGSWSTH